MERCQGPLAIDNVKFSSFNCIFMCMWSHLFPPPHTHTQWQRCSWLSLSHTMPNTFHQDTFPATNALFPSCLSPACLRERHFIPLSICLSVSHSLYLLLLLLWIPESKVQGVVSGCGDGAQSRAGRCPLGNSGRRRRGGGRGRAGQDWSRSRWEPAGHVSAPPSLLLCRCRVLRPGVRAPGEHIGVWGPVVRPLLLADPSGLSGHRGWAKPLPHRAGPTKPRQGLF